MTTTKRFLEEVYTDYLKSENHYNFKSMNEAMKEVVEEFNLSYTPETEFPENNEKIECGKVFLYGNEEVMFMYVITGYIEDCGLYECKKVSEWIYLANQNDLIVELKDVDEVIFSKDRPVIIETWNTIYLTEDEIKHSLYIGKLSDEDYDLLIDIIDNGKEIPKDKRGLTVPEGDYRYIQNKFHRREALKVKDYALRLLLEIMIEEEGE